MGRDRGTVPAESVLVSPALDLFLSLCCLLSSASAFVRVSLDLCAYYLPSLLPYLHFPLCPRSIPFLHLSKQGLGSMDLWVQSGDRDVVGVV